MISLLILFFLTRGKNRLGGELRLLTWLEDLDDNSLVIESIDALVNFRVLASTNLLDNLIVVLCSKKR